MNLNTCEGELKTIFLTVLKYVDHSILCGHRGEREQNALYEAGYSKAKYPNSLHNYSPSLAVDASPYPYPKLKVENYKDIKDPDEIRLAIKKEIMRCCYFAGVVIGISKMLGFKLKWGGDWDLDFILRDNKFEDLFHFELVRNI